MDIDSARAFLRVHHHAVLATRRRDARPQMSPVTVGVLENAEIVISSREEAIKTRNLRRDPSASLLVLSEGFYGPWVQLDGFATVRSLPEALDGLVAYYRSVAGEHPDWSDYRAAMARERRVLIVFSPERAGPNVSG